MTSLNLTQDRDPTAESHTMTAPKLGRQEVATAAFFVVFALLPVATAILREPYYLTLGCRILIMALAASGLNLVLSYGGMISFGHALYVGLGAYTVGILERIGILDGFLHIAAALLVGGVVAALVGSVCLRTRGVAFIMITLAFAQMAYVLAVGMKFLGGEDGFQITERSHVIGLDFNNPTVMFYVCLVWLGGVLAAYSKFVNSRFGRVIRGAKSNEMRLQALGFNTFRFKLLAYVASALICIVAGVLLANLTEFVSPSYLQWTASGELIVMIVLGGMGTILGPAVGAAFILILEECLVSFNVGLPGGADAFVSDHWLAFLGAFIVAVTLFLRRGLYGSLGQQGGN